MIHIKARYYGPICLKSVIAKELFSVLGATTQEQKDRLDRNMGPFLGCLVLEVLF